MNLAQANESTKLETAGSMTPEPKLNFSVDVWIHRVPTEAFDSLARSLKITPDKIETDSDEKPCKPYRRFTLSAGPVEIHFFNQSDAP